MSNWEQYFTLHPDFREQIGQTTAFEIAASYEPDSGVPVSWLFEFCTGYGKTLTAYGIFAILKARNLVDRMIVFVPTDEQRSQFAKDADDALQYLGVRVIPWALDKEEREIRMARSGKFDVAVATYQQLDAEGKFFHDLMSLQSSGRELRWMNVGDEIHHLGEKGIWAARWRSLPNTRAYVGFSATPLRRDYQALTMMPTAPTFRVSYLQAFNEGVVKRVIGREMHYYLDVEVDGKFKRLTTEELRAEGITDFSQYEAKRQLRYNSNYLGQMLIDPLQDLALRELRHPNQNRMVVFCMTCKHANHVSNQINSLCRQLGLPFSSQWVGVGVGIDNAAKTVEENRRLMNAFRLGEFEILVQVSKAEEGFNLKQVSLAVFLHLISADGKNLQQVGRALRRNSQVPISDDTATIYCSADSPIAELVKRMECDLPAQGSPRDEPSQFGLWDIPDLILIDANYDRTEVVGPNGVDPLAPQQREFCDRYGIPPGEYIKHFGVSTIPASSSQPSESNPSTTKARFELNKDQVNRNTSTLCGNIIKLIKTNGCPMSPEIAGRVKTAINTEWKRVSGIGHGDMTPDEFTRKNKWLQEQNAKLKLTNGRLPAWVTINLQ